MVNLGKHPRSQKAPWLDPQSLRSVKKIAKHLVKILIFLFFRRKRKKRRRMIWKRCRVDCKLSEVRAKGCLLFICYAAIKIGHKNTLPLKLLKETKNM